jgi:hypothetical protein
MKINIGCIAGLMLAVGCEFSSVAHAVELPILVKTNESGYVPDEYMLKETCRVFSDRVEIERRLSTAVITESRPITGGASLMDLVVKASKETLSAQDNQICDLPSTRIVAFTNGVGADHQVLLFETGGCGAPKQIREGGSAHLLREFIAGYCPKTND